MAVSDKTLFWNWVLRLFNDKNDICNTLNLLDFKFFFISLLCNRNVRILIYFFCVLLQPSRIQLQDQHQIHMVRIMFLSNSLWVFLLLPNSQLSLLLEPEHKKLSVIPSFIVYSRIYKMIANKSTHSICYFYPTILLF